MTAYVKQVEGLKPRSALRTGCLLFLMSLLFSGCPGDETVSDLSFEIGTGFNSNVDAIAPAGDRTGDIYVGGGFITYNGTGSNRIIRLNSNGSTD